MTFALSGCVATAPVKRPAGSARGPAKAPNPKDAFGTVTPAAAKPPEPTAASVEDAPPAYVAPLPNPNDFMLVANGGFDPGWRVGYDAAWVVQLPAAPAGSWRRAYLGAKLGRAKLEQVPGRPPWEKRRVRGDVDIAVAEEPIWPHSRRMLLARAEDVPLEGDPDNAAEGVGEARWFWVEVPVKVVSFDRPNFIVLYSPSESLKGPDRAPVLAGGKWPAGPRPPEVNAWLNGSVRGQPPLGTADAFKTPVNTFAPAVAIKLVPANNRAVQVELTATPEPDQTAEEPFLLAASVTGADVSRAWVEVSTDTKKWTPAGRALLTPPFMFTVKPEGLPVGEAWLRVSASDAWENRGASEVRRVIVPSKKK
jgi:hypothetical protein